MDAQQNQGMADNKANDATPFGTECMPVVNMPYVANPDSIKERERFVAYNSGFNAGYVRGYYVAMNNANHRSNIRLSNQQLPGQQPRAPAFMPTLDAMQSPAQNGVPCDQPEQPERRIQQGAARFSRGSLRGARGRGYKGNNYQPNFQYRPRVQHQYQQTDPQYQQTDPQYQQPVDTQYQQNDGQYMECAESKGEHSFNSIV